MDVERFREQRLPTAQRCNRGGPNHWEIWLRDGEGYTIVLASPDGTADGNWKPGA
ncbi:MAG TPA: hypothetical protein VFV87_03210 [Pirellulaceae bacterium]|nr:hypothetical protein [Pirellulaceae bacterium]